MAVQEEEAFVLFVGGENTPEYKAYIRVTRKLFGKYIMSHSFIEDIAKKYEIDFPGIMVFKQYDDRRNTYTGSLLDEKAILKFVKENIEMVAKKYNEEVDKWVFDHQEPGVFLFYGNEDKEVLEEF